MIHPCGISSSRATASGDLAGRDGRRRHVQIERRLEIGRHRDRDRIGAEPRLAAAEGRDVLRRPAGIGGGKPDHALAHRHHRIGREPPDMALPEHGAGRDIGGLRLLDRQRHRLGVDMETKAPVAVDHGRGRRFLHDGPLRAGHDMAGLDAVDIGRDRDHPVRIMAGEVGVDAADSDRIGLFLRRAGGSQQRRADPRETIGLNDWHGVSSDDGPRGNSGSCLLSFSRMVSKRWLQGKSRYRGRRFPDTRISRCGIGDTRRFQTASNRGHSVVCQRPVTPASAGALV